MQAKRGDAVGLILTFNRGKQDSPNPEILIIEHKGETVFVKPTIKKAGVIQLDIKGPKTFNISRLSQILKRGQDADSSET